MTQEAMKEKIEALTNNEEFAAKLKACETAQEIADLYATEGIEITAEEIDAAFDSMSETGNELNEKDLDNVAGGSFIVAYAIIGCCVLWQSAYVLGRANRKKK